MNEPTPIDQATKAEQLAADLERLKPQYPELVNDVANKDEWLERLTVIER
jgi:alkylhydroperoxidase/carboxymuconolactone decarboxylase family protein YurZ